MEDIKTIRAAYPGVTLNDVMVACLERAHSAYLDSLAPEEISEEDLANLADPDYEGPAIILPEQRDSKLSLIIPKAQRYPGDTRFENLLTVEFLMLDNKSGEQSTEKSMAAVHKSMMRVKQSHGIFTNVPGPTETLYFGSKSSGQHRVLSYIVSPPVMTEGTKALGVCSYNGQVYFSVMADATCEFPNQARILADNFSAAYKKMLADAQEELEARQQQQNDASTEQSCHLKAE
ncbi:hypothetical protein THASP1DRAFT_23238 [Thamnocephalis sphaerospora]|uniref:O-acyltransferase WSD1 C-terminal domain-containing protein n=1 Tax=Thamnocephalis sphaerospora TaxID=78915 RepID=A0A4P9XRV7_9FUNG|nr:hypothetical protein THASP1DRAFT_23238 [Thamnocephalis sphaerospora]|eukprot:RKP08835.1 hypothetical protein THASP1DRAFT_23238 [Thamnocephalis sphaerospora]